MGKKEIEMKLEWDGMSEPEPGQDGNESTHDTIGGYMEWRSVLYKNWGEKNEQEDPWLAEW